MIRNGNLKEFNAPRLTDLLENVYPERIREQKEKLENLEGAGEEELAEAEKSLRKIEAELAETQKIEFVYPSKTYSDEMTITLGGNEIRLVYPEAAHTDGNTIVHFVGQRAVHMGDMLFYMHHPYIDWNAGCDTGNWIAALEEVAGWDIDIVIPGHGELTGRDGLLWKTGYLKELRAEVQAAVEAGLTLEETRESVKMEKYPDLPWSYMLPAGIEAVYNELTGAARD